MINNNFEYKYLEQINNAMKPIYAASLQAQKSMNPSIQIIKKIQKDNEELFAFQKKYQESLTELTKPFLESNASLINWSKNINNLLNNMIPDINDLYREAFKYEVKNINSMTISSDDFSELIKNIDVMEKEPLNVIENEDSIIEATNTLIKNFENVLTEHDHEYNTLVDKEDEFDQDIEQPNIDNSVSQNLYIQSITSSLTNPEWLGEQSASMIFTFLTTLVFSLVTKLVNGEIDFAIFAFMIKSLLDFIIHIKNSNFKI